ncbi:MAG: LysE family translocator, partial [Burkholderiales bacterium]|nr:LysE family translocator [Burkholderiales bacterium]
MLGTHDLGLFITTGLVLNLTPGVDMLYTISRTAQGGWRSGLAAAAGICAGCVVHTLAAALGLAALLSTSPLAFNAVKWVGAAYLLWLGVGMLRTAWRGAPAVAAQALAPASAVRVFRQGFVTNVLNP